MKALSFRREGHETYGLLQGDHVVEARADFRERYRELRDVLDAGLLDALPANLAATGLEEKDVDYLPVIPRPGKVLCIGVNYRPHAEEMGRELPQHPLVFVRFADSQVGHREPLRKPAVSGQYDYEGELAVIIGQTGWQVDRARAYDLVAGYACFMDGSVRDWQRHSSQFTAGKNFRGSGAVGPWLVTRDEIPDPARLTLETRVNGEVLQSGRLDELIFDIPALIAYVSTFTRLEPGDLLVTGTPSGVGAARTPPRWLLPGDVVEVDLGPVGCLMNPVQPG